MGQPTPGRQESGFQLDTFTVCAGLGAILIAAGVLLAIEDLEDGGSYSVWFALREMTTAAIGVLVLLSALRLGNATWGPGLRRATPAIGIAFAVASAALVVNDLGEDFAETFWRPANDLFFYVPITLAAAIYLSATPRADRVLGSPSYWGRILGVVALVIGLAIAIDDVSDIGSNEIWVFLSSFGIMAGLALFLLALSLEPTANMTQQQGGQIKVAELLNDSRLPNWIAMGGVAIVGAGVLLGFKSLDAPSDGIWLLLRDWGYYLGLGAMVLIASGGVVAGYRLGQHPYLRYALIAGLVAMFLTGLNFAADADSDQIWVFLSDSIEDSAFLALAYAMFEAAQRPLQVVS